MRRPNSRRPAAPALLAASCLSLCAVLAAVSLWGAAGVPIAVAAFAVVGYGAVRLSHRGERLFRQRTADSGVSVFAGLLDGVTGGDLTITETGYSFQRGRGRRPITLAGAWTDVTSVRVMRKGPYGSAALFEMALANESAPLMIEVSDGARLLAALGGVVAARRLENDF